MTPTQLNELGALMLAKSTQLTPFWAQLCAANAVGAKSKHVTVRSPASPFGGGAPFEESLAEHLYKAGLSSRFAAMRADEPLHPNAFSPIDEAMAKHLSSRPLPADTAPDGQALICLRLLLPSDGRIEAMKQYPWAQKFALERLHELMVDFPALLHPGLVFQPSGGGEPLPLMHTLAAAQVVPLPGPGTVADAGKLASFVKHPAIAMALKARAPKTHGFSGDKAVHQDKTAIKVILDGRHKDYAFLTSLLRTERERQASGVKSSLFAGEAMLAFLNGPLFKAVVPLWMEPAAPGGDDFEERAEFKSELKSSPVLHAISAAHCLATLRAPFLELAQVHNLFVDQFTRLHQDVPDRLCRLIELMPECGIFPSADEAAATILNEVFPRTPVTSFRQTDNPAQSRLPLNDALLVIRVFEHFGVDRESVKWALQTCNIANSIPNFHEACDMLLNERKMTKVIANARAAAGADAAKAPESQVRRTPV